MQSSRPLCSEASLDRAEPQWATASRIDTWLLVETSGAWPYDAFDAPQLAIVREHVERQLAAIPRSRLLLIKRPGRRPAGPWNVFLARTRERGSVVRRLQLDRHAELRAVDVAAAVEEAPRVDHPLLLVCTHGKRDRCCARYGQELCRAVNARIEAAWMWQTSHVGGDRFAGNLVCLPEGLYFGRVGRHELDAILTRYRAGRIDLSCYRGRSCYPMFVQAAERAVRDATGLDGLSDLRVASARRAGDGRWTVDVAAEVSGDVHRVLVERREEPPEYLTCRAASPRPIRRYAATVQ